MRLPDSCTVVLQRVQSSYTWGDVLEQGLPYRVLQGPHVLGRGEVFVRQVGLVDLPLDPKTERNTPQCHSPHNSARLLQMLFTTAAFPVAKSLPQSPSPSVSLSLRLSEPRCIWPDPPSDSEGRLLWVGRMGGEL